MGYSTSLNGTSAKYVFSDFSASLANGAELDSGWIDMGDTDKYQFEGLQ